jgi:hypothetical protein
MSFIIFLTAGFFAGVLGGMGMGGGTILIPTLTILCGVEQHVAQATNLIAFIPMAVFSLAVHKREGLLKTDGLLSIIIPAVISSVVFGFTSALVSDVALKKMFGIFLVALAIRQTKQTFFTKK